jgi:uncharacterized protein (TIGR00251 family)
MTMALALRAVGDGVQFAVKVVPGAARDRVVGLLGNRLKVQVAAPPEGGKANARLCELLAAELGVATRAVQVISGAGNARKIVAVQGLTLATAQAKVAAWLTAADRSTT